MREWLSGGAPPCQGGGRGFDPRLALESEGRPVGCPFYFANMPTKWGKSLRLGAKNEKTVDKTIVVR